MIKENDKDTELTETGRQYAAAYTAQYTARDLPAALQLYLKLIKSYPDAREASYARTQVQNIINTVVPEEELLDAEVVLAVAQFEHQGSAQTRPMAVSHPVAQLST